MGKYFGSPLTQEYGILMRSFRKYGQIIYKSRIFVFDCRRVVAFTAGGGEVIEGERSWHIRNASKSPVRAVHGDMQRS